MWVESCSGLMVSAVGGVFGGFWFPHADHTATDTTDPGQRSTDLYLYDVNELLHTNDSGCYGYQLDQLPPGRGPFSGAGRIPTSKDFFRFKNESGQVEAYVRATPTQHPHNTHTPPTPRRYRVLTSNRHCTGAFSPLSWWPLGLDRPPCSIHDWPMHDSSPCIGTPTLHRLPSRRGDPARRPGIRGSGG